MAPIYYSLLPGLRACDKATAIRPDPGRGNIVVIACGGSKISSGDLTKYAEHLGTVKMVRPAVCGLEEQRADEAWPH